MRALLLGLVVVLSACGPDDPPVIAPPQPALTPAMGGTWRGTTTYVIAGLPAITANGFVTVSVLGTAADIGRVCPNGDGAFTARGEGTTASWTGALGCSPVNAFSDCASVTPAYSSASVSINGGTQFGITASGTATGCGTTRAFTATFIGGR